MKRSILLFLGVAITTLVFCQLPETFTMDQVMSYPFTNELHASVNTERIVWAMNEKGVRNLYVAEGPDFTVRKLTDYTGDTGQEFSSVSISEDGEWVVYIRGGDFGSNWDDAEPVNPNFLPEPPPVHIWTIPYSGGEPVSHGKGEQPVLSHDGLHIAFVRDRQIWISPTDGSEAPHKAFNARGSNGSPRWSPDDQSIAFVSTRESHAFIGVFHLSAEPITWISPSFHRDRVPVWSPNGSELAFIRRPGQGGKPRPVLQDQHEPWTIMIADVTSGEAVPVWSPPETIEGSPPSTQGRYNLRWGDGALTFLSYHDGWPHLYGIPDGSKHARLLTEGNFMAEYISMSPDGRWLVFAGNTGPDQYDIDRRHIVRVSVDGSTQEVLTPGTGNEWTPFVLAGGERMAFVSATAQRPPLPAIMHLASGDVRLLAEDLIPEEFPQEELVTPMQVIFKAPDGTPIHGTLFRKDESATDQPAIVYIHGGPPRQMLLGWHYSSYYSNAYAVNQYLASRGAVVLSVNYRLGIGYGYDFHKPVDGGTRGASEYQDIKAAGQWLAAQPFVDTDKIGVYGGSYGGYLTAMALGRDSDLFAAGVDIHGVHDRVNGRVEWVKSPDDYEHPPDADEAIRVAYESSPIADVPTWESPVLIIHGDDDRNVQFSQSVDLVQRLEEQGVEMETLVIPDDTHHFMTFRNQHAVNAAAAEFLLRKLF